MQEHSPSSVYKEQIKKHQQRLKELLKKRRLLGWLRFFVFIFTVLLSWKVFTAAGLIGLAIAVMGIGLLLYLVSIDVNNNQKISATQTLIGINEEELRILDYDYYDRYDGNAYAPHVHDYANDLDLFGKASIFQWSHRCYSEQGRNLFAQNLLQPLSPNEITERQEAVTELASDVEWRQQFQRFAMQTTITVKTQQKTLAWLEHEEEHYTRPVWKLIVQLYSIVSISTIAATVLGYISPGVFSFLYAVYFTVSILLSRNTIKPYLQLSGIVKEVDTLHQLMNCIENKTANTIRLKRLQQEARTGNKKAAVQIKELKNILDRFDLRLNLAGLLFFNSFLLWDVRQMIALNDWKQNNKTRVKKWFDMIAEAEVLISLATIRFNQPHWCFPKFSNEYFSFDAVALGHPLIPGPARVNNDFDLHGRGKIGLITGSNMAGKSTFLRSIGVNIVLAQMGAPVCAEKLILSPVRLMSSMRVADNLAENTSTFYAELKKLKTIIETVNRQEPVFILLDEILRGTNSFDRHKGSEALIAQLIKEKSVAVIATHDLELAKLKNNFTTSIENYHFDVQVNGEELFFDYQLKPGVCHSLNASILMKKIGIELL